MRKTVVVLLLMGPKQALGVIADTVIGIAQTSKSMVKLENKQARHGVGLPVPEMDAVSGLAQPRVTGIRLGFFARHF